MLKVVSDFNSQNQKFQKSTSPLLLDRLGALEMLGKEVVNWMGYSLAVMWVGRKWGIGAHSDIKDRDMTREEGGIHSSSMGIGLDLVGKLRGMSKLEQGHYLVEVEETLVEDFSAMRLILIRVLGAQRKRKRRHHQNGSEMARVKSRVVGRGRERGEVRLLCVIGARGRRLIGWKKMIGWLM
jgi:hypothetical protein